MSKQRNIPFKSANTTKQVASVVLWIMVGLSVFSFFMAIIEFFIYSKYDASLPVEFMDGTDDIIILISAAGDLLYWLPQLVFIIVFLMWVYRTYKNLIAVQVVGLQHGAGWAVSAYFVPIVNLFMPYIVMKEVYVASLYAKTGTEEWKTNKTPKYILIWWIFYIVGNLLFNVNQIFDFNIVGDYQKSVIVDLIAEPMYVLSLLSLFFIMRKITNAQDTDMQERMKADEEEKVEMNEIPSNDHASDENQVDNNE